MEAWIEIDPRLPTRRRAQFHHPGERDLVVELSICRSWGRSVRGAPPESLTGDVPAAWVDYVGLAQIEHWIRLGDGRLSQLKVLTAGRAWRFHEERVHSSKGAAGRWALDRDPSFVSVRAALEHREQNSAVPIPALDQDRLLRTVRARLLAE